MGDLCSNVENKKIFTGSLTRAAKCSGIIFVTIDAWHHSKTTVLKLCAHAVRDLARALTFNIAYNTLH